LTDSDVKRKVSMSPMFVCCKEERRRDLSLRRAFFLLRVPRAFVAGHGGGTGPHPAQAHAGTGIALHRLGVHLRERQSPEFCGEEERERREGGAGRDV